MELRYKVIIFWAAITCLLWLAAKVKYHTSNTTYTWEYWKKNKTIGLIYYYVLILGPGMISTYVFVDVAMWWFS